MAQQNFNVGALANDGTGDQLRTAFQKAQANFTELYNGTAAATSATPVALTDAATIAVAWTAAENFTVTLAGNRTLALPTGGQPGTWRRIQITQDGTGGRTLAFASGYVAPGGIGSVTLSTAAGAVDVVSIYCRTTSVFEVYIQKALA